MTTTFETAKVGDRVFSIREGWTVIKLIKDGSNYPIVTEYNAYHYTYTIDGKINITDKYQTLFWDDPKIVAPPKPIIAPPVDTLVEVCDGGLKTKGYSCGFTEHGKLAVWDLGRTSKTSFSPYEYSTWDTWRVVE